MVFRDLSLSERLPPRCCAAVGLEPGGAPPHHRPYSWPVLLAGLGPELLGADEPRDACGEKEDGLRCGLAGTGRNWEELLDEPFGKILFLCWDLLAGFLPSAPPLSDAAKEEEQEDGGLWSLVWPPVLLLQSSCRPPEDIRHLVISSAGSRIIINSVTNSALATGGCWGCTHEVGHPCCKQKANCSFVGRGRDGLRFLTWTGLLSPAWTPLLTMPTSFLVLGCRRWDWIVKVLADESESAAT